MKYLKYLAILLLFLGLLAFIAIKAISMAEPEGEGGEAADALAHKMLSALNKEAFDTLPYLSWEFFREGQKYLWDKTHNQAIIEWDNNRVIMQLDTQDGIAYKDGVLQSGESHKLMLATAWSNWCNDSFWMIAPFKVFDPGTSREIVRGEDGNENLLIKYASGGVTPGDSYMWILDKEYKPTAFRMWTSIIPVKGMYVSWEGWERYNEVLLSSKHNMGMIDMEMENVKSGNSLLQMGYTTDPFEI